MPASCHRASITSVLLGNVDLLGLYQRHHQQASNVNCGTVYH